MGSSDNVGNIFEALKAWFGLTAWDARVQLWGLRRDLKTLLRKHATKVERLAQVAYGDLPAEGQRSLAHESFFQSVNIGLKKHWRVAKVDTMKKALRLGNAYFRAHSASHEPLETPRNRKAQGHSKLYAHEVSPPEMSCWCTGQAWI